MLQISWTRRQQHRKIDQTSVPALETARRGWGDLAPVAQNFFFGGIDGRTVKLTRFAVADVHSLVRFIPTEAKKVEHS
jgi:hypothetical protein